MKTNNRIIQYLIILLALANSSFVLASDANKKEQVAMPAAPSGPYRSQTDHDMSKQTNKNIQIPQIRQQPLQHVPEQKLAQRLPQQQMRPPISAPRWNNNAPPHRMIAPNVNQNWNRNAAPQAQWTQRPPQQQMRPPVSAPAWVNKAPHQRMQAPQVPDWVKNPPYGPKPPAWVINPQQQPAYQYGNRRRY